MLTRLSLTVLLANLVTMFVASVWCLTRTQPTINEAAFGQIKEGMTLAEVETLIGAPPGNYHGKPVCGVFHWSSKPKDYKGKIRDWVGKELAVSVYFDERGRVDYRELGKPCASDETLSQKLHRWCFGGITSGNMPTRSSSSVVPLIPYE